MDNEEIHGAIKLMQAFQGNAIMDTWGRKPDEPEVDLVCGLPKPVFEAVFRSIFAGNRLRMLPSTMYWEGGRLTYTPADPVGGGRVWRIVRMYSNDLIFWIEDGLPPEIHDPVLALAERMVEEGTLGKTDRTRGYYRTGIVYPTMSGHILGRMVSTDVYRFIEKRYEAGDPADIVIARMLACKVVPIDPNGEARRDYEILGGYSTQIGIDTSKVSTFGDNGALVNFLTRHRADNGSAATQDQAPARWARAHLRGWAAEGLTDRDFENFDTAWKAAFAIEKEIHFLSGEDIRWAYHQRNHARNSGAGSCMSGDQNQKELDIYCNNPKQINLACVKDDMGLVLGRCLIWIDDTGQKWYDRIYSGERFRRYMQTKFAEQGILSLQNDKRSFGAFVTLEKPWVDRQPPYLDTMHYININGTVRREMGANGENEWVPVGSTMIRHGWPSCKKCGTRVPASELKGYSSSVPCATCLAAAANQEDAETISVLEPGFTPQNLVAVGNGMIKYNDFLWAYNRDKQVLVKVGAAE